MIYYRPTDGDVYQNKILWRVRTAFLMTQLGDRIPEKVLNIRGNVETVLARKNIALIDADHTTTGKDFLLKIWELVLSVPIGIAIIYKGMPSRTLSNIFYELGWMHAFGKETIVVKEGNIKIPSDFVRTEYIPYDNKFERRFGNFIASLEERLKYYEKMAEQMEKDPLLAIDYLRRAFLLCGDEGLRGKATKIFQGAGLDGRARNSVENLLVSF